MNPITITLGERIDSKSVSDSVSDSVWQFKIGGVKQYTLKFEEVLNPLFTKKFGQNIYDIRSTCKYDIPPEISSCPLQNNGWFYLTNYQGGNSYGWQMRFSTYDTYHRSSSIHVGNPARDTSSTVYEGHGSWIWGDEFPKGETTQNPNTSLSWMSSRASVGKLSVTIS